MKRLLRLGFGLGFVVGCRGGGADADAPPLEELHAKNAALIEPKLAAVEKIAAAPLPAPTGTIEVQGPPLSWIIINPDQVLGNTALAFEVDLEDLSWQGRSDLRTGAVDIINDCAAATRDKKTAGRHAVNGDIAPQDNPSFVADMLRGCPQVRYLVVVKIDAFKDAGYIDAERFAAGGAAAAALVFDLDTGTYAGGVEFAATSSSTAYDPSVDLAVNFYAALGQAVNAAAAGSTL